MAASAHDDRPVGADGGPPPVVPSRARGFIGTVVALGSAGFLAAIILAFTMDADPFVGAQSLERAEYVWPATAAFAAAFLLLERQGFVFRWRGHSTKISLDEIALFLGFAVLPLPNVVLGVTVSALANQLLHRRDLVKGGFNVAQYVTAATVTAVAVGVFRYTGVPTPWPSLVAPVIFATTTSLLVSALFSRMEGAPVLRVYRERFGAWVTVGATLGASLGLILFALWRFNPVTVIVILPVLFYLKRFGRLSEWADAELKAHQHLASVSTAVAGSGNLDQVADKILDACRELFECGEAQLTINDGPAGIPRYWRRSFTPGGAGVGGVTVGVFGVNGQRIGELTVFPEVGQHGYGERERQLLRTVAASASAAAANANALRLVEDANRELAASERRYRGLFDMASVIVLVLDERGRVADANPAALESLGYERGDLLQRSLTDILPEEDHPDFQYTFQYLKDGGEVRGVEGRLVTHDGVERTILLDLKALAGPGDVARYVILARDITYLKVLEEELRHALGEKEETIRRLENMNRELEEFTLWTTHDMREPLRGVGTLAKFLYEDIETLPRGDARDMAKRIHEAAERLKERVKALHAFSRIVQRDEAFRDVDLSHVLDGVLQSFESVIRERRAIVRAPDEPLPTVRAQPHRIDQVFANLVENALKYGSSTQPVVEITVDERPDAWLFRVRDNGPGIPVEYHERIFNLFQRGPGAREPGTGAGLAIVKRIVEQHGGRVWVESHPDDGACFTFTLPRGVQGEDGAGQVRTRVTEDSDASPRVRKR